MTDVDVRLIKCFRAVFPGLRPEEAVKASQDSLESWDSIAMATLLTIVAEEFGIPPAYEMADELDSYAAIRDNVLAVLPPP